MQPFEYTFNKSTPYIKYIKEFFRFRELFFSWILRELQIRYKQSLLGFIWAILQPAALMVLFVIVFSTILKVPTDGIPYPIFAYTGLLPWIYLNTSITFGASSLVNNMNLVTKIYFPREILPLATIAVSFVDFIIGSSLLFLLMIFYHVSFQITLLWVPLLIIVQTLLMVGVVLFTSGANAIYRDIRFIIPLALQLWMYATPIIYPLSIVPEQYKSLYLLNPMAVIIESYRYTILKGLPPDYKSLAIASIITLLIFTIGFLSFKRVEEVLPDVI